MMHAHLFIDTSRTSRIIMTRSSISRQFYIKSSRLEVQSNLFSRIEARVWNQIPESLRELSKKQFAIQYNTIQEKTRQDKTIQYNTIQYNTIQYNTMIYLMLITSGKVALIPEPKAHVENARLYKKAKLKNSSH